MVDPPGFGAWLKQRRRMLDLTQQGLANLAGYAVSTIRNLEAGFLRPSRPLVMRLIEVLEVPSEERAGVLRLARRGHAPTSLSDRHDELVPTPDSVRLLLHIGQLPNRQPERGAVRTPTHCNGRTASQRDVFTDADIQLEPEPRYIATTAETHHVPPSSMAEEIEHAMIVAPALNREGLSALRRGDYERAEALLKEALWLFGSLNDSRRGAESLAALAEIALGRCRPERGARLLAAARVLRTRLGASPNLWQCARDEQVLAAIRAEVDAATFAAAWADGQQMGLAEAVRYGLDFPA